METIFDPYTGVRDDARVSAARKSVFTALGVDPPVDAILWPSLQRTAAPHEMGDAAWDGVTQSAIDLGPVRKAFWVSVVPAVGSGSVSAVSLRLQLADAEDAVLYEASGGIQLLEQIKGNRRQELAPQELFRDRAREPLAVHAALRALVMTEEEIEAEMHPKKRK